MTDNTWIHFLLSMILVQLVLTAISTTMYRTQTMCVERTTVGTERVIICKGISRSKYDRLFELFDTSNPENGRKEGS